MALALVVAYALRSGREPVKPAPTATPAAAPTESPAAAGQPPAPGPVPQAPAEEARPLLESASPHPLYRRALGSTDVPRRFAVVLDQLAQGDSPRKVLASLAPKDDFSVVERGSGKLVIAPTSYARYDPFADAVASLDAAALVSAYQALHDVIEGAYRALGYPEAKLDEVSATALRRILDAPVREGDVEVVPHDGQYRFADRALEDQGEVEKHLLRMGPRNTRLLQAKARELQAALGGR